MTTEPRKAPPILDLGRGELGLGLVVVLALTYVGGFIALAAPPDDPSPSTSPAAAPRRELAATAAAPASPRVAPRGAKAGNPPPARAPRIRTRSS